MCWRRCNFTTFWIWDMCVIYMGILCNTDPLKAIPIPRIWYNIFCLSKIVFRLVNYEYLVSSKLYIFDAAYAIL